MFAPVIAGEILALRSSFHLIGLFRFQGPALSLVAPTLPAYDQVDFRAAYACDMWTLSLFAKNAFDCRGLLSYNGSTVVPDLATGDNSPATVSMITPRTIGVSLRADF